jgi:hypothetical protein
VRTQIITKSCSLRRTGTRQRFLELLAMTENCGLTHATLSTFFNVQSNMNQTKCAHHRTASLIDIALNDETLTR